MYGTNIELPTNRMLSYESAHNKWASIAPIRGRSDQNTRPLANRRNDNLTIRQLQDNGDIAVRLYYTDIITYHTDGTITLDPYGSVTTNRLVWSILGPHVNPLWSDSKPHVTKVGGRYYHTPQYAHIQPRNEGWELIGGSKPIEVPYLNRKLAKQALKDHDYNTFVVWLETQIRLNLDPRHLSWRSSPFQHTPSVLIGYLKDGPSGWSEIAQRMSTRCELKRELESIRSAIYKYEMCYEDTVYEYFDSYTAMTNAFKQAAKVG
jgi:hypothetical protein